MLVTGTDWVNLEISHLRAVRAESSAVIEDSLEQIELAGHASTPMHIPTRQAKPPCSSFWRPRTARRALASFLEAMPGHRKHYSDSIRIGLRAREDPRGEDNCTQDRPSSVVLSPSWPKMRATLAGGGRRLLWRSACYVDVVVFGSRLAEQERVLARPKVMVGSDGFSISSSYRRRCTHAPSAPSLNLCGSWWTGHVLGARHCEGDRAPAAKVGLEGRGSSRPGPTPMLSSSNGQSCRPCHLRITTGPSGRRSARDRLRSTRPRGWKPDGCTTRSGVAPPLTHRS